MPHVSVREELPAARDAVWALLRDFGDVSAFLPEAEVLSIEGSGEGAVREVETSLGRFVERCESHDEAGRTVGYTVDRPPPAFPYSDYHAVFRLIDGGPDRCFIEWSCDFRVEAEGEQAETLTKALEAGYRHAFIASIRQALAPG